MLRLRGEVKIVPAPFEGIDSMLRRFKKAVQKSGISVEARKHECFEKPSIKRRKKSIAARIRLRKHLENL